MLRFDGVTKRYADGTLALDNLSLEVAQGELITLVGPSGCGKTTTMKLVNRLEEPTAGRILLDGEDIAGIDPVTLRRRIGYVIQQGGLFPHRTVADNTAAVLRLLGWGRRAARDRASEMLELVGLDPAVYGPRYPAQLSGGQRQRVGVARALAADPPVLLMDEPYGAVDPVVREHLQNEFLRLQAEVRKTVLFVTHDIEEAVRLGDRIAVFGQGRIEQVGAPATVLGTPGNDYVARFVGADRGLKRLAVTLVEQTDLEQPPVVNLTDDMTEAVHRMRRSDARWAVVLDDHGALHGWVPAAAPCPGSRDASPRTEPPATGTVAQHARRMEAWLPLGASLKQAFSTMLQYDAGWIAVLDGDRFLGVLTPARLHEALRRSIDADSQDVQRADVELETLPRG